MLQLVLQLVAELVGLELQPELVLPCHVMALGRHAEVRCLKFGCSDEASGQEARVKYF